MNANNKKLMLSLISTAAVALVLQGCGRTSDAKKVETKSGANATAAGKPCNADNCPKVKFEVQAQGAEGTVLVAYAGMPVTWTVSAVATDGSSRDVGIYLNGLPKGATSGKALESVASVAWTATTKGNGTSPVKVLMRDLTRCNQLASSKGKCTDPNANLTEFDQTVEYQWRVDSAPAGGGGDTGAQVVRVSDLSCGGLQTTSSGQVMAGAASAALPAIIGVLSGNLGAVVPLIPGIIGTVSGGDEQKTPTQC